MLQRQLTRIIVYRVIIALAVMALAIIIIWFLTPRFTRAAQAEQALASLKIKQTASGVWRWQQSQTPMPRRLESIRREEITNHYQSALNEIGYATQSSDPSGLRTYFEESALEDALLAAGSVSLQANWGHDLRLRFYAPDGATVAFTDSAWVGFIWQDNFEIRYQVMDVVMRLSDGNWRIVHWRILQRSIPKLERNSLLSPNALSGLRGVNYVGRLHPFGAFWDNWNAEDVRSSFRLAKAIKLPVIRFFIPYPTPESVYVHLPEMLAIAKSLGIRLMPTLLDSYTDYRLEDLPNIHASIERLLPMLRDLSIFAIDLKNEAERDAPKASWRNIRGVLGYLAIWLQQKTKKPITAGLSDPDVILARSLDFVTVHHYGSLAQLETRLIAAKTTGKPVLLQEFGFHTQINKLPDPHTEAEQAEFFSKVLALCRQQGVGWMAWNLHDFTAGSMPNNRVVERFLGLVRANGSLKPSVSVLLGNPPETVSWFDRFLKLQALLSLWWLGLIFVGLWFGRDFIRLQVLKTLKK